MSDKSQKIKDLLELLKIQVDDESNLEKDFDSILEMFDQLSKVETNESSTLLKKKIKISDLRKDIVKQEEFKKELKGKYMKVPSVSKKN